MTSERKTNDRIHDANIATAAVSVQRQKRGDAVKIYLTFIKNILTSQLTDVLFTLRNAEHLQKCIMVMMSSITDSSVDISIPRACFGNLKLLIKVFHSRAQSAGTMDSQLQSFIFKDCTRKLFEFALLKHVDLRDPQCIQSLKECASLMKSIMTLFNPSYGHFLVDFLTNELRITQQGAQDFATMLLNAEQDVFFQCFKTLVQSLKVRTS
jgi:hypothetical protein